MRNIIFNVLFTFVFLFSVASAQTNPVQITGGRFFIKGGSEEPQNARLETANFTAIGFLGGQYSPWYDICKFDPNRCSFGKTFSVLPFPRVYLGGCIGECHQFVYGTFTTNGTTYQNSYYRGNFDFSRVDFQIPRMVKRKGLVTFRKPFSMTGHLQVCQETNIDRNCPADKILFDGDVEGEGTLTVTTEIKIFDTGTRSYPYLFQKSFEYQFE